MKDGLIRESYGKLSWPSPDGPRRRIHIDLLGPLNIAGKYQYVLVIQDAFSKFVVLCPCISTSSKEAIQLIERDWVSHFGRPETVVSDSGTTFSSEEFRDYVEDRLGAERILATPTHHQQNGRAERLIRSVTNYLRCCIDDIENLSDWISYLPIISYFHNTTPDDVTKFSPHFVVFMEEEGFGSRPVELDKMDKRIVKKIALHSQVKDRLEAQAKKMERRKMRGVG